MKNNPDYRKSFADQKRDSSSGVKKSDLNYYDYYDEDDYSYYNYDADSNNDNEEKIESGGARRPTPTNYLDLKSGNRKKYQNHVLLRCIRYIRRSKCVPTAAAIKM